MKTKRTLIVSVCMMVVALIVAVVGVSAAWFGDILTDTASNLVISSTRPIGQASIDIESAGVLNDDDTLTPAITVASKMLADGVDPSTLDVTKTGTYVETAASQVTVIFPFSYLGVGDSGQTDGKKAVKIYIDGAYLYTTDTQTDDSGTETSSVVDTSVNYVDDFNVTFDIVKDVTRNDSGTITGGTTVASTAISSLTPSDGNVYYKTVDKHQVYMLVDPGVELYCRAVFYFNKVDEELSPKLVDTVINVVLKIEATDRETA